MSAHKPAPKSGAKMPGSSVKAKPVSSVKSRPPRTQRRWLAAHAFGLGVGISVLAHAALLATGFVTPPAGLKKQKDRGLEVVLVNAKHAQAPVKPQALAQANLDGGGTVEGKEMPSSPLPPDPDKREGESLVETKRRVQELETLQRELIAASKNAQTQVERKKKTDERPEESEPSPPGIDLIRATAIARQEAVVDKLLKEYASRPRKAFVGPRTKYASHAQYLMSWSTKVARVGELNFPRNMAGSLYGSVQVHVEVRADGSVVKADIVRPDPNPKINDAALRIIHIAAPFASFPPEIQKDYDILEFVRTLTFTREDVVLR